LSFIGPSAVGASEGLGPRQWGKARAWALGSGGSKRGPGPSAVGAASEGLGPRQWDLWGKNQFLFIFFSSSFSSLSSSSQHFAKNADTRPSAAAASEVMAAVLE